MKKFNYGLARDRVLLAAAIIVMLREFIMLLSVAFNYQEDKLC